MEHNTVLEFVKRHRLLTFFLITYAISWGVPGLALLLSAATGAFAVSIEEYSPLSGPEESLHRRHAGRH